MYDSFWPTLPKSGITSNGPSEIFVFMVACGNDFGVDMKTCCCELQKFNELNTYDTCAAAREAYRDRLNDEILYNSISCEQQILRNELARQNAQTTDELRRSLQTSCYNAFDPTKCDMDISYNGNVTVYYEDNFPAFDEKTNESKMHDLYWEHIESDGLYQNTIEAMRRYSGRDPSVKETDYSAIGKAYVDSVRDVTYDDLAYLKPYDEISKDIQTSDETETSTEKDDIYHDKSSIVRMIRKAVNRLDDFIGFIVRELKEDFI